MTTTKFLADGTEVEIINRTTDETGIRQVQIKPVDAEFFASGVNPWTPECYLFSRDPTRRT